MNVNLIKNLHHNRNLSIPEFELNDGIKLLKPLLVNGNQKSDIVEISTASSGGALAQSMTIVSEVGEGIPFAVHSFKLDKLKNMFVGFAMDTFNEYQFRGYGELLRLASVMHMRENGLAKNSIESLSNAIPFHYKYGFRPDFGNIELFKTPFASKGDNTMDSSFNFVRGTLLYLTQNRGLSRASIDKAHLLLDSLMKNKMLSKEELAQIDALVKEYIEVNLSHWDKDMMLDDIPMSLDMDRIVSDSIFYNNLFKKHGIDYEV